MGRPMRRPSAAETAAISRARDDAGPFLASLSDAELAGIAVATLREMAARDGLSAASAWCASWSDRLMLAAGRDGDA